MAWHCCLPQWSRVNGGVDSIERVLAELGVVLASQSEVFCRRLIGAWAEVVETVLEDMQEVCVSRRDSKT